MERKIERWREERKEYGKERATGTKKKERKIE
jgi:hypothetical protein